MLYLPRSRYGGEVSGIQQQKSALRARLLAARSAQSAEERAEAGRRIRDALLALAEVQMAGTIAAYYSVGSEPDTRRLVYALWKRGSYVLLPLLGPDGDLDWASYEGPDSLRPGPRGLLEPAEPPRGADAVARADVVLVPALAVDAAGQPAGPRRRQLRPGAGPGRPADPGHRAAVRRRTAGPGARRAARHPGPGRGPPGRRGHVRVGVAPGPFGIKEGIPGLPARLDMISSRIPRVLT